MAEEDGMADGPTGLLKSLTLKPYFEDKISAGQGKRACGFIKALKSVAETSTSGVHAFRYMVSKHEDRVEEEQEGITQRGEKRFKTEVVVMRNNVVHCLDRTVLERIEEANSGKLPTDRAISSLNSN